MVDYVAVLRRTIDALPKNTPEIRTRVYDRARTTVQSKLAMINPAPSQALIDKQMRGLEAAIGTVEADFAVAVEPDVLPVAIEPEADPLADVLSVMPVQDEPAPSITPEYYEQPSLDATETAEPVYYDDQQLEQPVAYDAPDIVDPVPNEMPDRQRLPETATLELTDLPELPDVAPGSDNRFGEDRFDDVFGELPPPATPHSDDSLSPLPTLDEPVVPPVFTRQARPKAKSRILLPLLGLALLGGAGALAWTQREAIIAMLEPAQAPAVAVQTDTPVEPAAEPATEPAVSEPAVPSAAPEETALQKFTQRLNVDGTETDAGTSTGSGVQSVAQLEPATTPDVPETPAAPETPVAPETPAADPAATETPPVTPPATETPAEALPIGQKAIFYEERTSGADGSARSGAVVWSVVRESPGNDRPPEPAVRGELTIPEAGLSVRMTLRRNADATLPASHILELIMTVPEDFSGGTIEDVQRVNFKPSEESAGAALAATPVKVADKFFLVALEKSPAAEDANLKLLREQNWIDLPVVYRSGRRALFTMEKGLVGDQVFKQVLDAWVAAPLQ